MMHTNKNSQQPKSTKKRLEHLISYACAVKIQRWGFCPSSDESTPPKAPWGINIMKKSKKAGPKAFGVRLEECQPGANNKVRHKLSPPPPPRLLLDVCFPSSGLPLNSFFFSVSLSRWSSRSAVASWRRWVWNTPESTESRGIMPWCRCFRTSWTRV